MTFFLVVSSSFWGTTEQKACLQRAASLLLRAPVCSLQLHRSILFSCSQAQSAGLHRALTSCNTSPPGLRTFVALIFVKELGQLLPGFGHHSGDPRHRSSSLIRCTLASTRSFLPGLAPAACCTLCRLPGPSATDLRYLVRSRPAP